MSDSFSDCPLQPITSGPGPGPTATPEVIGSLGRWVGANNSVTGGCGAACAAACAAAASSSA